MAAVAGHRWWPDRRPPRSAAGLPIKQGWGNKMIPNPPSAAQEAPERRERGFWAPQPGRWANVKGQMRYVRSRAEPPGWQEPRKKLQFPQPTPVAHRNDRRDPLPTMQGPSGRPPFKEEQVTREVYARMPTVGEGRRPLATISEANGLEAAKHGKPRAAGYSLQQQQQPQQQQQQHAPLVGARTVSNAVARIEKRTAAATTASTEDVRLEPKEEPACVIS